MVVVLLLLMGEWSWLFFGVKGFSFGFCFVVFFNNYFGFLKINRS